MSCDKPLGINSLEDTPNCSGCTYEKDFPFVNTPNIDKTASEKMPDDYQVGRKSPVANRLNQLERKMWRKLASESTDFDYKIDKKTWDEILTILSQKKNPTPQDLIEAVESHDHKKIPKIDDQDTTGAMVTVTEGTSEPTDSIDGSVHKMMDDLEIVGDLTIPTDISHSDDLVGSLDDVKTYTHPGTVILPLTSHDFNDRCTTDRQDPIQKSYEKNIIDEKFSDFVKNDFSLVLSLDEILNKYNTITELRQTIDPLKKTISHLKGVHTQLGKLAKAINYHEEVDPSGIDTESLETAPKLIKVPNHSDELILIATTGMTAKELNKKYNSAYEKLLRTIQMYNSNVETLNDIVADFDDEWNGCFYNKMILDRFLAGRISWKNVNFAIKIVTTGYEGFKTPKMVIGLAYNRIGQKLCHTLDFISPLDEFSMETSLNNLLDAYEKTIKTTKEGN